MSRPPLPIIDITNGPTSAEPKNVLSRLSRLYRDPTVELICIDVEVSAEFLANRIQSEFNNHGFRMPHEKQYPLSGDLCELKTYVQSDTWWAQKLIGPELFSLCTLRFQFTHDSSASLVDKRGRTISCTSSFDYSLTFRCCSRPNGQSQSRWDSSTCSFTDALIAMFKSEVGAGFYYVKSTDFRLLVDIDIPNDTTLVRNPPYKPVRLTFPLLTGTLLTDSGDSVVILDYAPQAQHTCKLYVNSRRVPPVVTSTDVEENILSTPDGDVCLLPRRRLDKRRLSFGVLPPVTDSDPEDLECDGDDSQYDVSSSPELQDSAEDDCYACDPDVERERWDLDTLSMSSSSPTSPASASNDVSPSSTLETDGSRGVKRSRPFRVGMLFGLILGTALTVCVACFLGCLDLTVCLLSRYLRLAFDRYLPHRLAPYRRRRRSSPLPIHTPST